MKISMGKGMRSPGSNRISRAQPAVTTLAGFDPDGVAPSEGVLSALDVVLDKVPHDGAAARATTSPLVGWRYTSVEQTVRFDRGILWLMTQPRLGEARRCSQPVCLVAKTLLPGRVVRFSEC